MLRGRRAPLAAGAAMVIVLAATVAAIVAYGRGDPRAETRHPTPAIAPERAPKLTPRELVWIGELQRWHLVQVTNGTLRDCSSSAKREVGVPPSRRLGTLYRRLLAACAQFEAANADERRAFAANDAEAYERANRTFKAAEQSMQRLGRGLDAIRGSATRHLPVVAGVSNRSRIEPHLSKVAGRLIDRPVEIRCWSKADWPDVSAAMPGAEAFALSPGTLVQLGEETSIPTAHLSPRTCSALTRMAYLRWRPAGAQAIGLAEAVGVFAHEVEHLTGNWDEGVTECYAVQRTPITARRLGASRAYAHRLALLYARTVHPLLPRAYVRPECAPGTTLDLGLAGTVWP